MDKAKKAALAVGLSIIVFFFVIVFLLFPYFKIPIGAHTLPPLLTYSFLFIGIIISVSVFLPYNLGKILREISYMFLLISILFFLIIASLPHIKRIDVPIERCASEVFPEKVDNFTGVGDMLAYASCILTGYYTPDTKNISISVFMLFYVILPFAFILSFVWGIFIKKGGVVDLSSIIGKGPAKVITFIMALYAARVFFGAILLEFVGYGVWGLAMVFVSFLLTSALRNLVESKFKIEEFTTGLKDYYNRKQDFVKKLGEVTGEAIKDLLNKIKNSKDQAVLRDTINSSFEDLYFLLAGLKTEFGEFTEEFVKYLEDSRKMALGILASKPQEGQDSQKFIEDIKERLIKRVVIPLAFKFGVKIKEK